MTNEDYKMLGETMFKGFQGLMGARWDLLEKFNDQEKKHPSRFAAAGLSIPSEEFKDDVSAASSFRGPNGLNKQTRLDYSSSKS